MYPPIVTVTSSVQEEDTVFTVFKITHSSHTVGNLLQVRINDISNSDPRVMYIAYTRRHPLENFISVKIRTPSYHDAVTILMSACSAIVNDLDSLLRQNE